MNSQCLPAPCPWYVGGGTGTAGTGNSTGTGGTGGGGNPNGAIVGSPLATFDSGLDGFMFGTYDEPANLNGASSTIPEIRSGASAAAMVAAQPEIE